MVNFEKKKTETFFEKSFPQSKRKYVSQNNLANRDLILIKNIFPRILKKKSRILDFACGKAEMLSWLSEEKKVKVLGIEKSKGQIDEAIKLNGKQIKDKIVQGSVSYLEKIDDGSFDIILAIGIFQYLSDKDFKKTFENFNRILSPKGILIATFQNLFFDLFTFNRFTLDFYFNNLFNDKKIRIPAVPAELKKYLTKFMPYGDKPQKDKVRARDNIYVRLSNPLTIKDDLTRLNFKINKLYYYDFSGLPPEMKLKFPSFANKVEKSLELKNSENWRGAFMANAFICELSKLK